mgnify:CR=1 FL=1
MSKKVRNNQSHLSYAKQYGRCRGPLVPCLYQGDKRMVTVKEHEAQKRNKKEE